MVGGIADRCTYSKTSAQAMVTAVTSVMWRDYCTTHIPSQELPLTNECKGNNGSNNDLTYCARVTEFMINLRQAASL